MLCLKTSKDSTTQNERPLKQTFFLFFLQFLINLSAFFCTRNNHCQYEKWNVLCITGIFFIPRLTTLKTTGTGVTELSVEVKKKSQQDPGPLLCICHTMKQCQSRYENVTLGPLLLPARVMNWSHSTYGNSARNDSHRAVLCPNSVVSGWKN
jgi:hypothetical protein